MTSSAQGKRDEEASNVGYHAQMSPRDKFDIGKLSYAAGFDAGYSLARNEAQVLVEALDNAVARCCAQCSADRISYLALAAYEKGDA